MQDMQAQLVATQRELQHLVYVISHDLQAPLRAMRGFADLLLEESPLIDNPDQARYLRRICDGAAEMQSQLCDLLEYARIDRDPPDFERVDLGAVVDEAQKRLAQRIEERRASVQVEPLPMVFGQRDQLVTAVSQLLDNAIKFTAGPPEVQLSAEPGTTFHTLLIRDNGVGIEPGNVARIFDVFCRLSPRDEYGGNGIGLALVRRIAVRHGGGVWVESSVGRGSTFSLSIPAPPAE